MTSFDGEDTIHLGEVQDDRTASEDSNVPVGGGEEFSQASVHYSEASSSVLTTTPVCDDHNGEHTLDFNRDAVSVKDIHPESSSEIPPSDEIDEVSITSTLVTNPSVVSGSVVSAHSNYTENSISSSYETSSHRGAKLNLDFLPVRGTSRSSGGSVYSRSSSKRSVRRRDVIKPVALPPSQAPSNHEQDAKAVEQLVPSRHVSKSQWTLPLNPADLDSCPTYTNYSAANNNLALVVHGTQPKGMEPPETTRGGGCDPPGEEPSSRPSPSLSSHGNRFRSVQWVDPKNIADEREIDHDMLNRYRELSNDCSSYDPDINELMGEKRIRIATISSGYKTANFFVREDLDQRIYFHELEDAVSYMARRGYARMEKGQEKEWMKLLKRAHEVVKVGPTKKKQRYRKGKLVLIMYKLIKDEVDHYSDVKKKSSQCSISSEANTAHTSLGRSIRCGYKSYSEKFLAELETGKSNGVLMLTNGPIDAPSYYSSNASSGGGLLQITNGLSATSIVEEEKSHSTVSDKRGVYGGGVRYFTPDKSFSEDGDEESEESEDDSEDKSASDDFIEVEGSDMGSMFSEDEESHRPSNDGVESVASSTVNSEMSSIARNQNGVYMASDNKYGNRNTLNKRRAPTPFDKSPDMVPISDESESGSWE